MKRAVATGKLPGFEELQRCLSRSEGFGGESRERYARHFGYGVPCREVVAAIAMNRRIVELGAGSGFWSFWLQRQGCDVIATDPNPHPDPYTEHKWVDVANMDARAAVVRYPARALLMVWPHYTASWPVEVVRASAPDQALCYVGEGPFGCCALPEFFGELARMGYVPRCVIRAPSWPRVTDYLMIFRRGWII